MTEYVFGANIMENLTTGMYQDSKVIYREYIQNSCDQIDKAYKEGLLKQGQGKIDIWFDREKRLITIEDNATGIPSSDFERILGNIADSNKKIGEDKGFRGIGRLCGLAYCDEVIFTSSSNGEKIISTLTCDASKMRKMIVENESGKKHTASDILNAINKFSEKDTNDIASHFFRVELVGINSENTDLLNFQLIKDYLSFVAPVPYQNTFIFRTEVYEHAKQLKTKIDEYAIKLEGEQIFKKYTTILKKPDGGKYDEIFDIKFQDFYDDEDNLFAWMWFGLTQFSKVIPNSKNNPSNPMRGLRLRKENIQIGSEDALQKLFKEDRGNNYFVGEIFATSRELIPNSQRDYFNENGTRAYFEEKLQKFFTEQLSKIYRDGSEINSAFKKIETYEKKTVEFEQKRESGSFVNDVQLDNAHKEVEEAKSAAEKAKKDIDKKKDKTDPDDVMNKIIVRIEKTRIQNTPSVEQIPLKDIPPVKTKPSWRSDRFAAYNKKEKKLISEILGIICSVVDSKTAEMIIQRIEEEL